MTNTATKYLMMTAAAFCLSGTAFAQDAMMEEKAEQGVEMMKDGAAMAEEGAEMVEEATDADMMAKDEMMPVDGMMEKSMTTTTVEPAPVVLSTEPLGTAEPTIASGGEVERIEVACPVGSTAQPDGTCMLEGDALPE